MDALGALFLSSMVTSASKAQNYDYNIKSNQEAAKLNYLYGEMSADKAQKRQIETYRKLLSPEAQLMMYKEAGLSPGLMYSNGVANGMGGVSAPMGQGAGNQHGHPMNIGSAMEYASMLSQIDLNKAQARKLNAEANVTEQTGINEANARIGDLLQSAGLKASQQELTNLNASYQELENEVYSKTKEFNIYKAEHEANKVYWQVEQIVSQWNAQEIENQLNRETFDAQVENINLRNKDLIKEIALKGSQIKLNDEQIKYMQEEIAQKWLHEASNFKNQREQDAWYNAQTERILKLLPVEKGEKIADATINAIGKVLQTGAMIWALGKGGVVRVKGFQ